MTASSEVGGGKDFGEVDIVHIAGELIWVDETCLNVVGLEESEDL